MGRRTRKGELLLTVVAVTTIVTGSCVLAVTLIGHQSTHPGHLRGRRTHIQAPRSALSVSQPASPTEGAQPDSEAPGDANLVAVTAQGVPADVTDPSEIATAVVSSLPLYSSPAATSPDGSLPNPNYLGASLVLLVTALQGGWVQTYVPTRPNGATAWVPLQDVTLSSVPCHIVVSLGARQLVLFCHNTEVFETTVAPGAPSSPTPTGSYFVAYIVKLTDPGGPYGPYALGTSAFSDTYYSFDGGPGQIGIHGTDQPWVIGSYASHGCVRLPNDAITTLAQQVVPGTPVEIGP